MSTQSPRPEDAVQLAQQAIRRLNEMEETVQQQAETIAQLQSRVQELEAAQPDADEYDRLDRDDKIGLVRQHLVTKADDQRGRAQIDYQGIRWEVFSGGPSPGHCYDLMELTAQEPGFMLGTDKDDTKTVKVDLAEMSREKERELLSRANKATEG